MSYATRQELIGRYGERLLVQLSDRADPPTGEIGTAEVDRALADADAVCDGYLAGRYALPLAAVPPQLPPIAQAIAIYKLHTYQPEQKIVDEHSAAIADLVKIAQGVIKLPVDGIEPASAGSEGVETIDRPRDFTPENLRNFI